MPHKTDKVEGTPAGLFDFTSTRSGNGGRSSQGQMSLRFIEDPDTDGQEFQRLGYHSGSSRAKFFRIDQGCGPACQFHPNGPVVVNRAPEMAADERPKLPPQSVRQ